MTKSEKEAIIQKAKDLGFNNLAGSQYFEYELPLGLSNSLVLDIDNLTIGIAVMFKSFVEIRKIESPEDLQLLFDAICPEKFRLPFN